jgi:hypothetical protein
MELTRRDSDNRDRDGRARSLNLDKAMAPKNGQLLFTRNAPYKFAHSCVDVSEFLKTGSHWTQSQEAQIQICGRRGEM